VSIHYPVLLSRPICRYISIGRDVIIRKDTWINVLPDDTRDIKVRLGDNCVIGPRCTISAKNLISVGKDVITASSVLLQDHNHAHDDTALPIRQQGVTSGGRIAIEYGCWIGHGAAIVCNEGDLVIGHNSVVGANSLVTRSFPPYSVIVGNPARLARKFDPARGTWVGGEAGRPVVSSSGQLLSDPEVSSAQ